MADLSRCLLVPCREGETGSEDQETFPCRKAGTSESHQACRHYRLGDFVGDLRGLTGHFTSSQLLLPPGKYREARQSPGDVSVEKVVNKPVPRGEGGEGVPQ